MPYIANEERERLDPLINALLDKLNSADRGILGRLNYVITRLIGRVWNTEKSYFRAAALSGVLANVYSEFYRRVMVPYEDAKKAENGDVYMEIE